MKITLVKNLLSDDLPPKVVYTKTHGYQLKDERYDFCSNNQTKSKMYWRFSNILKENGTWLKNMKVIHTHVDNQSIIWKELLYVQYLSRYAKTLW